MIVIMKTSILTFVAIVLFAITASAQLAYNEEQFRLFDGKGNAVTMEQLVKAIGEVDAVFLGELHDDAVGHAVQAEVFRRVVAAYCATRQCALSLEMFERDVQTVLDEYLAGQISENHFMLSSRPWPNYKTDYKPLVELAKEKKLPVLAANAPRRYVNIVSRNGRDALNGLSKTAKGWLPPLPFADPSAAYSAKFKALMGPSAEAQMGLDKILMSQSLWDASMAYRVSEFLKANKRGLVVHLNGGFHTESRLGTVEHFLKYRPKAKVLVVTMRYEEDFKKFDAKKHTDIGDYVVLTIKQSKNPGPLSQILKRMDEHNKSLDSIKARVRMVKVDGLLGKENAEEFFGAMDYVPKKASRKMYLNIDWEKPAEKMTVIDDDFKIHRPGLKMLYSGNMSAAVKKNSHIKTFAALSMTLQELKANYQISLINEETIDDGTRTVRLQLKPKTKTEMKIADAWVDGSGMIRKAKIQMENGDETTVLLSNIVKNAEIDWKLFTLLVPDGTRLLK